MAVQQEIKSQLAKLLANEDIVVEHKNIATAQFNVHTRVLILPLWEKASNYVYDMLVGHEVGHALFTPDQDPPHHIPKQFVNVVEDARIEKLMKRKYMGIAKSFYRGYNELHKQDFFELDGEDITTFNLADRANLYFKVGSFLPVAFSSVEKPIIDLIHDCETFEDTVSAAEALYNFCKQEQEKDNPTQENMVDWNSTIQSVDDSDIECLDDNSSPISDTSSSDVMEDRSSGDDNNIGVDDSDVTVETANALESNLQDLVNKNSVENVYVEIPQVDLESIIAKNSDVHKDIDSCFNAQQKRYDEEAKERGMTSLNLYEGVDTEFRKFKRDAQKEVSYLVKEFECRKAATSYSRSATSRTGVLDCNQLPTYKFNEDIFKKITIVPDGKNHGLVFILDWSGSMQYVLQDTLKQLYNLMWFCKKVQIPFEVYAFTHEWNSKITDYETGEFYPTPIQKHYEKKEGVFSIDDDFNLMNIFSSKVRLQELEHQMINIWRLAHCFGDSYHVCYTFPRRLSLSGTPLNETLISLHQILPQFQKDNGLEKVQCIILTDGEANGIPYHKTVQRHWESLPYLGVRNVNPTTTFLRDRKVGKTYKFGYRWHEFANVLLTNLKDRFPSTNFIGIRVLGKRDANSFIKMHVGPDEKIMSDWRKNKSFVIKSSGYDAYFGLASTNLSQDAEFDVDDDATKAQIKRAFVKSLKTKKLNKKVLGEFISLVS